ncbi:MAG TPA: Flp pilus assembly protein CpaB [Dehalococcoidia bacterium]|nr:Flp pilus assembly protein CpaB [Dehalococcoidia bacterium]
MTIEDVVTRRRGEGGSRGVLLAGLVLGLVAAILIAIVLSRGNDSGGVGGSGRVAVVAVQDIPARTRITRDMLEVRNYEAASVSAEAFTSASQLVNRVAAVAITAGQPILPVQVSATAGEGLSFAVGAGMRGISISASEVSSAGGNVSPGNHVDIVGVFSVASSSDAGPLIAQLTGEPFGTLNVTEDSVLTFTLLQDIRVLAVAQTLSGEAADSSGNSGSVSGIAPRSTNARATTITLEVTPQQAQILALADQQGDLRLSLRPFGDTNKAPVNPIIVPADR